MIPVVALRGLVAFPHMVIDFEVGREESRKAVDEALERDRKIMHRRLIDGIHFEPLAEEFDMSVRQIKRIVASGTTSIFSHIK